MGTDSVFERKFQEAGRREQHEWQGGRGGRGANMRVWCKGSSVCIRDSTFPGLPGNSAEWLMELSVGRT